ncbi:MAG: hypothetical protein WAV51_04390 [Microgenomates group bacterium]
MKKPIVIGSIVFAGCIIVAGIFVYRTKFIRSVQNTEPAVTVAPKALVLWEDPAGFSFTYPADLTVNKHDEDTENYAHVELTSAGHAGNIIIWAKDTTYQTIDAWVKGDSTVKKAPSVDTTLGGKEAKKIILSGVTKKMITGAIDVDVLITVEADMQTDEAYWTEIHSGITQTFVFTAAETTSDMDVQTGTDDSSQYDEEEVLE